jgi:phytanoyl-CoA hydroxylase
VDDALTDDEIAQYRRDGYLVRRGLLGEGLAASCRQALADLASGRIAARETTLMFEPGTAPESFAGDERERYVRKYMDYVEDAPALKAAAMNGRLHRMLDQLLGSGRVLFQEMALVKPPIIGGEKPWHQDAAYFRVSDPGLIVGVWIALDPAQRRNGCMEVVPGSHLGGAVPHVHEDDFNRCRILEKHQRAGERVALEMQPGDALIFNALLHHYTGPNNSVQRRRALQFHYHQIGAVWCGVEEHRRLFHFADGSYAGCTVPHEPATAHGNDRYRGALPRKIVPVDEIA